MNEYHSITIICEDYYCKKLCQVSSFIHGDMDNNENFRDDNIATEIKRHKSTIAADTKWSKKTLKLKAWILTKLIYLHNSPPYSI